MREGGSGASRPGGVGIPPRTHAIPYMREQKAVGPDGYGERVENAGRVGGAVQTAHHAVMPARLHAMKGQWVRWKR